MPGSMGWTLGGALVDAGGKGRSGDLSGASRALSGHGASAERSRAASPAAIALIALCVAVDFFAFLQPHAASAASPAWQPERFYAWSAADVRDALGTAFSRASGSCCSSSCRCSFCRSARAMVWLGGRAAGRSAALAHADRPTRWARTTPARGSDTSWSRLLSDLADDRAAARARRADCSAWRSAWSSLPSPIRCTPGSNLRRGASRATPRSTRS